MKCPYRKIIYHFEKEPMQSARDVEGFAECYGTECPFYSKSVDSFTQKEYEECLRALKEI